jgi:hypothetical protein
VANGIRSPLAPGFKFWPVSMDPRGRSGPTMAQLHKWVAEHGSTTSRNNGAEEAGEIVDRFTARVSIAMHRTDSDARIPRPLVARQSTLGAGVGAERCLCPRAALPGQRTGVDPHRHA